MAYPIVFLSFVCSIHPHSARERFTIALRHPAQFLLLAVAWHASPSHVDLDPPIEPLPKPRFLTCVARACVGDRQPTVSISRAPLQPDQPFDSPPPSDHLLAELVSCYLHGVSKEIEPLHGSWIPMTTGQ